VFFIGNIMIGIRILFRTKNFYVLYYYLLLHLGGRINYLIVKTMMSVSKRSSIGDRGVHSLAGGDGARRSGNNSVDSIVGHTTVGVTQSGSSVGGTGSNHRGGVRGSYWGSISGSYWGTIGIGAVAHNRGGISTMSEDGGSISGMSGYNRGGVSNESGVIFSNDRSSGSNRGDGAAVGTHNGGSGAGSLHDLSRRGGDQTSVGGSQGGEYSDNCLK
jgi:hypothetical protein